MTQKIEPARTRSTPGTPRAELPKAAPAAATAPVAPVSPAAQRAVTPAFQAQVKSAAGLLQPKGPHVGRSAAPDALWGAGGGERKEVSEFRALPPAQQKEKLTEVRAQRAQLEGKIEKRAEQLDKKWDYLLVVKKAESLREFIKPENDTLKPEVKAQLTEIMAKSEAITAKLDAARVRARELGPSRDSKASPAERSALAQEIRALRRQNSEIVQKGTELVDAQGLKLDRLANAETTLDPNVKPEDSLWGMINTWVQLSSLITAYVDVMVTSFQHAGKREAEMGRELAEIVKKDEQKKRLVGDTLRASVSDQLANLATRFDSVSRPNKR